MARIDSAPFLAPVAPRLALVEEELQRALKSDLPVVDRLAEHVRAGQGKRLRPALLLLTSRFCGYSGDEDIRFGAVFEMIHTATLVHDDVIDRAATRRSRPTLNALWGNTLTVLFGDFLYIQAMGSAIRGRSWRIMEILCDVTARMIEGELIQHDCLYKIGTTHQEYFEVLERKTALLFSGCTESAAVLAGRSDGDCAALRCYGLEIGKAFQLVDDLLDYTASSEQLGKPAFSDLREGKLTLPLLSLLERAPDVAKPLVESIWQDRDGAALNPGIEAELRDLLRRYDVFAETSALAEQASQAAANAIRSLEGEAQAKELLLRIPELLLERTR